MYNVCIIVCSSFFFFYIFSRWQVNHLRNFLLYLQVCYGRVWISQNFILAQSSWGTSMGKFKRVNICYRATVFHIPKKTLKFVETNKIALILTDKHYFLITLFVEIINTITRIFQWSFRSNIGLLLKWNYTFNYCIKDFIASVQHS